MKLPVYTELSNFSTRVNGKKISMDISIVLIVHSFSDPVQTINSIYQLLSTTKSKAEFILVNLEKEGYKYDRLLSTFPVMRVILAGDRITIKDAIAISISESLSKNILFIDDDFIIKSMNLEVLNMYLSESGFGMLIPLISDEKNEVVPNVVKGNVKNGFINTISTDIIGTAISSLYPKYFCFILNRDAVISRDIELSDYKDPVYTILELGYKLWKEGYIITQARGFKAVYLKSPAGDISKDIDNPDYLLFNLSNITHKDLIKGRVLKLIGIIFRSLFRLKIKNIGIINNIMKKTKEIRRNNISKPVEDFTIFSIINRDIK